MGAINLTIFVLLTVQTIRTVSGWHWQPSRIKMPIPVPQNQQRTLKRAYKNVHSNHLPLHVTPVKRPIITLDDPIVPSVLNLDIKGIPSSIQLAAMMTLTVLVSRALQDVNLSFPRIPSYALIEAKANETLQSIASNVQLFKESVIPNANLGFRVFLAKLALSIEKARHALGNFVRGGQQAIDISMWNPCTLESREDLMGKYTKYRFKLEDEDAVVPLLAGQELVLCSVDSKNRMLKQEFYPVSDIRQRGSFEIVVLKNNAFEVIDERFAKALEGLAPGDELAFKSGKPQLIFPDSFAEEIRGITVVSTGLGITSTMQVLRHILSEDDTTVEQVDLVWMNEQRKDFVLEKEIETLELQHFEKFVSTKVLEDKVLGTDMWRNADVREATPDYTEGQVAIVCAPRSSAENMLKLLASKGYPEENIAFIETIV